ncbi:MAG: hypothetical protein K2Q18_15355 [Bdellovibrionales bacterium]|nr:hypothetical protein [Bdellovibrionales bacterium]
MGACSNVVTIERPIVRIPSDEGINCNSLVRSFYLKENFEADLEKALVDKKLITFSNKFVTIEHPRLEWLNRARISLNKSIKNWNNNEHPAFYIFSDEDVIPQAKEYFETISSMVTPDMAVAPTATKNLEVVNLWVKSFETYQKDINDLLDERISLQYNLSLLKKLKLKEETLDVRLTYKREGKEVSELITLRKSDKNQGYYIKKLQSEIADLDGSLLKNGKIKDRVIRQSMLIDILTIVQREFEYGLKNTEAPNPELFKELGKLNDLLKNSELRPSTYGVYRITNQIFIRELAALSKLDVAYKNFIESPILKIKEIVNAFIQNRPPNLGVNGNEAEKMGILKRIYAKISAITLKQVSISGGVVVAGGIGYQRYFTIKGSTVSELKNEDKESAEQLERTKEEEIKKNREHSEVIEVQINELIK